MTDNAPLNADDELLLEINDYIDDIRHNNEVPFDERLESAKKSIHYLILADRKKHEIQARLEELDYIRQKGQRIVVPGMEDRPVWSDAFRERIAELKAQQEEL